MLDPAKTLFFCCRYNLAINDKSSRCICVKRVDAKNANHVVHYLVRLRAEPEAGCENRLIE